MAVRRVVANIATAEPGRAARFYGEVLGMETLMDFGWIVTFGSEHRMTAQLSIMTEGGSGTPVPDISVEVDDLDETLTRARAAGSPVEYGPAEEPWGVRRFFVRDPFGRLVNVLTHL